MKNAQSNEIQLNDIRYTKGGGHFKGKLSSADDYLSNNYKDRHIVCFPPAAALDNSLKELQSKLKFYYEFKNGFGKYIILTNYSSAKHFDHLQLNPCEFDINPSDNNTNRILVFDDELHSIVNLRIVDSEDPKDLKKMHGTLHEDLKAIFYLHDDLIKQAKVCLAAIVVTTCISRELLQEKIHCQECLDLTITKDDLVDDESFTKRWNEVNSDSYFFAIH